MSNEKTIAGQVKDLEDMRSRVDNFVFKSELAQAAGAACKAHLMLEYSKLHGWAEPGPLREEDVGSFLVAYTTMLLAVETRMQNDLVREQMRAVQEAGV